MNVNTINKISRLFKVIADPTRIKILNLLKENYLSVNEIASNLDMEQSAISHQLKVLKEINLVKFKKMGKFNIYSLADRHVYEIFNQAVEHVSEEDCDV